MEIFWLHFSQLSQSLKEPEAGYCDQVKVQCLNDFSLHFDDILLSKGLGCEVYKIIKLGHLISFFILGRNEECCSANKLKLIFSDFLLA